MSTPLRTLGCLLAALLLAVFPAPRAAAQAALPAVGDTVHEFRLVDGSVVYGRVVEAEADAVTVETAAGVRIRVERGQLRAVRAVPAGAAERGEWLPDPHGTRLFFGPTARAVPAGEGYFGVYELFFPFVTYGVTDRFTVSAGTPVFPGLIGEVFYLAPKVEVVRAPAASVAVGALALFATKAMDGTVGLLYGVGTLGTPDAAVTAGLTVPVILTDRESRIGRDPSFMVGGERRIGPRSKLLSENYVFAGGDLALVSGGVRFFGDRLSADFGIGLAVEGSNTHCCIPLVNFVYSFGGR
jgi:hypothetical protein